MSRKQLQIRPGTLHLTIQKLLILIVLALILVTILAAVLLLAKSPSPPVMPSEDSLTWMSFNVDAPPASEALSITERPLFWDSRKPYIPDDEPAPEPVAEAPRNTALDNVKVLGVMWAGGASSVVLLKDNEKFRVSLNEDYLGWTLKYVFSDRVIFNETQTLNNESPNEKVLLLEGREPLPTEWQGSGSISAQNR